MRKWLGYIALGTLSGIHCGAPVAAQGEPLRVGTVSTDSVKPDSAATIRSGMMADWIVEFTADVRGLGYRYRIPLDSAADQRRERLLQDWLVRLDGVDYDNLGMDDAIDYHLLRGEIVYRLGTQKQNREKDATGAAFIPYAQKIVEICQQRENVAKIDPAKLAGDLTAIAEAVATSTQEAKKSDANTIEQRLAALRAAELVEDLRGTLREADRFYTGYDPLYSWWTAEPMKALDGKLTAHAKVLRDDVLKVPADDKDTIVGLPIGEAGMAIELVHDRIPYTPAELVKIAQREMAWCDAEMIKASKELGFGEDWHQALEHVKNLHVQPGEQPEMIRDLAFEAIRFLEANDLVTVPALAQQGWRMDMMSPERQRLNPYFLGGDSIIVSFPTDTMTHSEKLMSMRSNNIHFSRATVHHELIPGHHLQYHMKARFRAYRELFDTPFWMEGWALYWEMQLYDMDFAKSAEDRVGMLFWRRHRCARIIFSLSYQLGTMQPDECVQYLIDQVGHEPSGAAAEVRRSIMGGYSPLYQAAYMLGGLQIRQMHRELVMSGKMSNRQFHDAIMHENSMPIELLRCKLSGEKPAREFPATWRFADPLP